MPAAAASKPAHRGRASAPKRPLRPVAAPRRVSGPSRGGARASQRSTYVGRPAGVLSAFGELLRHPLLERLVRGRWSIALIAFALIGIVTLQLGLLQLNAGIGRSLVRERALERQNASLSIENSALASGERVQQLAARLGMAPSSPSALRFLRASYGTGVSAKAAVALRTPVHSAEGEAAGSGAAASEAATQSSASEASAQTPSSEASAQSSSTEAGTQAPSSEAGTQAPSAEAGASSEGEAAPAQAAESVPSGSGEASSGG